MFFSIITPCYNSTKTLYRSFESLKNQTFKDFEWILVDDCSTDNGATRKLILDIKEEADFPVKYLFSQENNFVVKSCSLGCQMAEGEYVILLGHDDRCVPNAFRRAREILLEHRGKDIAGLAGRCVDETGKFYGTTFKKDFEVAHEWKIRYKDGNFSELFKFTKRSILSEYYQFAERGWGGHRLLNAKISKKYKYIFTNEVFRVYDTSVSDSLTNSKSIKYPKAMIRNRLLILNEYSPFLHLQLKHTFKELCMTFYVMFKQRFFPDFSIIRSWLVAVLLVPAFFVGFLGFLKKR